MKTTRKYIIGLGILFLTAFFTACAADNHVKVLYSNELPQPDKSFTWHEIQPGLTYANVLADPRDGSRKEFFVVKVDPRAFEFRIVQNKDQKNARSLKEIHTSTGSVLTFNGAFFDEDFKAMGLLQDAQALSHKKISSELMNGVFHVPNKNGTQKTKVYPLKSVPEEKQDFMLQNGPVLIDDEGNIPLTTDTGKLAARTALAVDADGNVVLVVLHQSLLNTDNALSLYQFAHLLKEQELFAQLGLHSVLNLDGGPSTGVVAGGEYLPEINSVENAVITLPRKEKL